jgi:hypothetical protein
MTANSEQSKQKIELCRIPDDAPGALRALADFLDVHPEIVIDKIDLTSYSDSVFRALRDRSNGLLQWASVSQWVDLNPPGNDGRDVQVEITAFGPQVRPCGYSLGPLRGECLLDAGHEGPC